MSKSKPNYDPKPYRTGTWFLTNELGWQYTARPETYRQEKEDQINFPFYITPEHMQINFPFDEKI
jgi:hypothetical protein